MKYLFDCLDEIRPLFDKHEVFLFLDYDGTLSPIAQKPKYAIIPKKTKDLLHQIAENQRCKIAVISGRRLIDVSRLVGISSIIYGGNHGLELAGPEICFKSPVSQKYKSIFKKINRVLHNKLNQIKGVLIENKGLTLSIHFRSVSDKDIPLVKNIFCKETLFNLWQNEIHVRMGKKVLEVFPAVNWDKGKAVLWLLHNLSFSRNSSVLPIYIGDDISDEDAFKAIKNSGLTICVGKPQNTNAEYYLNDSDEVFDFLKIFSS